ncbi:MAG: hypothetical protein IPG82_17760 [Saprospiraceae bacterium]|nr:hypothetical protein [Saprospiraceae bacterium]
MAAIVESAGSFYLDTTYTPKRKLPVLYQIGNEDYGPGNVGPAIPLSLLDTLITTPGIGLRNGNIMSRLKIIYETLNLILILS